MINNFEQFLRWEAAEQDALKIKLQYIDITEDIVAGLLLNQIMSLYSTKQQDKVKHFVKKEGQWWLTRKRDDWWDDCRITPRQFDRAIGNLINKGLVEKRLFRFDGSPTVHIRLLTD